MNKEILESPIRFHLHGISGVVENDQYGKVGIRLMNEMWKVIKGNQIPTTGINHWVYLPNCQLFTGVELLNPNHFPVPSQLEPIEFELRRYLKHVHIGPYQALPQKWRALKSELAVLREIITSPSLEIYGHHCDDQSKLETTILIGLQAN